MNLVTLHTQDGQQYEAEYDGEGFTFVNLGRLSNAFIETVGGAHVAVSSIVRMEGLNAVRGAIELPEVPPGPGIGCWPLVSDRCGGCRPGGGHNLGCEEYTR